MNIKFVKNFNQICPERPTLFCFPFAGGGASAYNSWIQKMQGKITVCPIQLPGREERITFSLSHSGEWVLAVFAYQQAVGIDVQEMGGIPEYMEIAEKFFATEEAAEIRGAGNPERFYQYWAAKEAYLKALGIGLNRGMSFFSVRGNRIIENGKVKSGWELYPILIKDYAAYAAVQEKGR